MKEVEVEGEKISIELMDGSLQESKKEAESGVLESLKNLGVTDEKLSVVEVGIKSESGVGYWILNLLPILIPILFLVFFFWFI